MRVTIQPFDLAPYQTAFLYNSERFTAVEASTKAGKTAAGIQWAIEQWHDMAKPVGWETTWCAPVYEQSKIAYKRIKRALPTQYDVNDSSMTCFTARGDELRFKSADNVNNLYGPDARAVIFEEFTRAPHLMDAFMALRSTLTKTRGPMKLIGNYIGEANAGHQLALAHKGDPEWAHFIVNAQMAVDAGILDGAEVAQARRDLPHAEFMALYMCQGSAHPLQLMRSDCISSLWTNEYVSTGTKYLVVDVARFGRDKTIAGLWNGLRLEAMFDYSSSATNVTSAAIDQIAREEQVSRHNIIIDEGGVGGGVVDLLPGCVAFNGAGKAINAAKDMNYGNLRAQCYYTLADHVNSGKIYVNPDAGHRDEIALELEVVRRLEDQAEGKLRVIKKEEMKELIGRSPDRGDMMMMRMYKELQPSTDVFESSIANASNRLQEGRRRAFRDQLADRFPTG